MFIFYYAVLSEVSPPTALSPFAAAAITGAGPYRTTLMAWKYTLPAFVLPFVFVTDPLGVGLLLQRSPGMSWGDVAWITALATAGLGLLAAAAQGMGFRRMAGWERWVTMVAGLLLVFPSAVDGIVAAIGGPSIPAPHWAGLALGAGMLAWQKLGPARIG
jgi:TRAP-type uncharacterized transport system fused permease subunit